ncbi:hypothetical protein H4W00_002269 [Psychrobacter sp. PL19]
MITLPSYSQFKMKQIRLQPSPTGINFSSLLLLA